jgi:FXSXX-COOH protein
MDIPGDLSSDFPDLVDIDLATLRSREDSVLRNALQRVREQARVGEQIVAGFNSAI